MHMFTVACLFCSLFAVNSAQTITISTELGDIKGVQDPTTWPKTTIYEFKGIPYATPPIGNLRFRPSILNTTKYNGVFDATSFGPICPQPAPDQPTNEDCLFINIWTTKSNVDNANNNNKLVPVMVWIYGGGYIVGAGSEAFYNGTNLIGKYNGDFVYVSMNYRLGSLGFLSNQQIYDEDNNWKSYGGLNGLYDAIIALKWINKYISSYGGDNKQITIFGESAGGFIVCMLLISSYAKDLFQRAIVESGCCNGGWEPANNSVGVDLSNDALIAAGYPINNLTFLRSIAADQLANNVFVQASVDELILTDLPRNIYPDKNTKLNANEIIFGFNSLDGVWSWPNLIINAPINDEEYKQFISTFITNETQQNLLYNKYYPPSDFATSYPPINSTYYDNTTYNQYQIASYTINRDVCVSCSTLLIGLQSASNKASPDVYLYEFLGPGLDDRYYSPHGAEVLFVFDDNNKTEEMLMMLPWNQNLSDIMLSSWTNFGKYGNPNISSNVNILWNEYDSNNGNVMLFKGGDTKIMKNFAQYFSNNACDFWYNEVGFDIMKKYCTVPSLNFTN